MFQANTCLAPDHVEPVVASARQGQLLRWHDPQMADLDFDRGPCSFLFCITMYNEAPAFLKSTLDAIAGNLLEFASMGHVPNAVICVVADGHGCMHEDTRAWCEGFGFDLVDPPGTQSAFDNPTLWLQRCTVRLPALRARCGQDPVSYLAQDLEIQLVMAVKVRNAGKLDSHAWFFRKILPAMPARYVLQMDVGSQLSPHCLRHLWQEMENHPQCAALAPNVSTDAPSKWNDILQTWQYFDFLVDKVVNYPVLSAIGHLELLPGQCTLFRRSALLKTGERPNILTRYLSGLHVTGLFARNTFLTEDRVIAHDLLLGNSDALKLHYAVCAQVQTDRCQTAGELFRQRRRWLNGTLACRFYALRYLLSYVRARQLSWEFRLVIPLLLAIASVRTVVQFLYPSLLAFASSCATVILGNRLGIRWDSGLAIGGALMFLGPWLWTMHRSRKDPDQILQGRGFSQNPLVLLAITITATFCILMLTAAGGVVIMGALALGLTCIAIGASKGWRALYPARLFLIYLPTCMAVHFLLMSYAMRNFSDLSWGTKGLDRPITQASAKGRHVTRCVMLGWQLLTVIVTAFLVARIHVLHAYVYTMIVMAFLNAIVGGSFSLVAISRARART
jgi:chitin synthase